MNTQQPPPSMTCSQSKPKYLPFSANFLIKFVFLLSQCKPHILAPSNHFLVWVTSHWYSRWQGLESSRVCLQSGQSSATAEHLGIVTASARPQGNPTLTPEMPMDCSYSQTWKHTLAAIFQKSIRWTSRGNFHKEHRSHASSFLSVPTQGRRAWKQSFQRTWGCVRFCLCAFLSFCWRQ